MVYIVATERPPNIVRKSGAGRRANRDSEQAQPVGVKHALLLGSDVATTACGLTASPLYPLDLPWIVGLNCCSLCVIALEGETEIGATDS